MRFTLEQQREELQRAAAAASGKLRGAEAMASEARAQSLGLQQRLALKGQRAAELESLIGRLRAAQFEVEGNAARQRAADSAMRLGAERLGG